MKGRVGLVGCGLIGRGWAIVFARAGYETLLYDAEAGAAERALAVIDGNLRDLAEIGLVDSAAAVRARMRVCTKLEDALAGVAHVQESVPEDRALKARVFAEIDALAPRQAVLASSCSAIPGSEFLADIPGRGRCLIAHPANPPYLMPVVELVPTTFTGDDAVERCSGLMAEVGQVPVLLKKEIPGFVMNRLQAGVVCEAMHLVAQGVMSPEDIDKVMRHSLGLRWSFMGPFETMDLNAPSGFKDYATRYGKSYEAMGRALGVAQPWRAATVDAVEAARRQQVPAEKVGERQAWRDRRLMALLKHIAESDQKLGK
jgi:3-hydroxyacyl-CoA dehydrogenase